MHTNAPLRATAVSVLAVMWLALGWQAAYVAALISGGTLLLTMGFSGDRGERIWIVSTLVVWCLLAVWSWQGKVGECPPDAPSHCSVR